jgi:tRNA(Ile)-lysidine synthase
LEQAAESGFNLAESKVNLKGRAGALSVEGFRLKWAILKPPSGTFRAPKRGVNCEYFDADKVGRSVVLRHWRPGDRFQPIGMAKPVKLQDLFTNQKVLRSRRRDLMVAAATNGELFWVEGLRIGERFKLDKGTVRQLQWQWERL